MPRVSFQVFGIVAFALILFVGWDFTQRIMLTVRLNQTEQTYDQQLTQAEATHAALIDEKKRVQTDAYIEDKVRREKHYVRDGEILVIPQITLAPAANAATPTPTPAPPGNAWQDLLDLIFGP